MLVVMKEVLPAERWVSEPKLLAMMRNKGVVTAKPEHFAQFYRRYHLLDPMMAGAGGEAKGHQCIFVNRSQDGSNPRARYYYKLPTATTRLLYESPLDQPGLREMPLRRQRQLDSSMIEAYTKEYAQVLPAASPPTLAAVSPLVVPYLAPPTAKARRGRSASPRPSSTPAGSASKFGDRQVCVAASLFTRADQSFHRPSTASASTGLSAMIPFAFWAIISTLRNNTLQKQPKQMRCVSATGI